MTKDNISSPCFECGTNREIIFEGRATYYELPVWYCPKCRAGCGELTDEERKKYNVQSRGRYATNQ